MYPEPFFLIDKFSTTFRNSAVNRVEDKKSLAYLGGPRRRKDKAAASYVDTLEAGYSYVPAGIVQAMFVITHCLLRKPSHLKLEADPMMPLDVWPRHTDELILFATPTSVTEIVRSVEGGLRFQTSSEGVRVDGAAPIPEPEEGDEFEKMGVVTRIRHLNQTITLISAKHGRAVEAISRELATSEKLNLLAEMLRTPKGFPPEFQALYCVRMKRTPQGPRPDKTTLMKAFPISPRA
jgi:hypothetical protein